MTDFSKDNLFLLEFLVDRVTLEWETREAFKCYNGELCVAFQFLDNPIQCICEEDFLPKRRNYGSPCKDCGSIKNGKSCLFALTPDYVESLKRKLKIPVETFLRVPSKPDEPATKMLIGLSEINATALFQDLMETVRRTNKSSSKTMKECYRIFNDQTYDVAGHLSVYLRMTCLGKTIVNQFQMNLEAESVDFRADQGYYNFQYNKTPPRIPVTTVEPPPVPCPACYTPASPPKTCPCLQEEGATQYEKQKGGKKGKKGGKKGKKGGKKGKGKKK